MSIFAAAANGVGNLSAEQRREIYNDLRRTLHVSEHEPQLALAEDELRLWAKRYAALLEELMLAHPVTRAIASAERFEVGILEYGQPATDAFLDAQILQGKATRAAGLPGVYVHAFLNAAAPPLAHKAAKEVLSPSSAAIVEERYTSLMLLRHGLNQEGFLGTSGFEEP